MSIKQFELHSLNDKWLLGCLYAGITKQILLHYFTFCITIFFFNFHIDDTF